MSELLAGILRVGNKTVEFEEIVPVVKRYLEGERNQTRPRPYAYPAYDRFNARSDPDELTDGDLLTPVLLNVRLSIRAFYELQRMRPQLERALAQIPQGLDLTAATQEQVEELTAPLYRRLDERPRPYGVKETTLSKILSRKRPRFLILHDQQVQRCYYGASGPVRPDPERGRARYMCAVTNAVAHDLNSQDDAWSKLTASACESGEAPVTRLRLLDVVAWHLGSKKRLKATACRSPHTSAPPAIGWRG